MDTIANGSRRVLDPDSENFVFAQIFRKLFVIEISNLKYGSSSSAASTSSGLCSCLLTNDNRAAKS